jgi:osmotically-inducible protein OsmY
MFNFHTPSFTRAVIAGGLLSLAVVTADVQAAPLAPVQAQQSQPAPDSEVRDKIYKAIADDKAISGYAQTLKVIVSSGMVSLKGSVRTDADKKAIGEKADAIAGAANVMNNLVIVADAKPKPQTE